MGKGIIKICPICNKKFTGDKRRTYCSRKCSAKSPNHHPVYNINSQQARLDAYSKTIKLRKGKNHIVGKIEIVCLVCSKKVLKYQDYGVPKFCSRKCWSKYLETHPNLPANNGDFGFKKGNTYWRTNSNSKYLKGWIKLGCKKYWYDSSYEKEAMKMMFASKVEFIRDYKVDLGKSIMFIDFYLPKYNKLVEAKGYFREDSKQKIKEFEKLYNRKIDVIQAPSTKDFCIKFKNYLEVI